MTTATRRLRRVGVAGLATITAAGIGLFASGGSAFAFGTSGAALGGGGTGTIFPGQTAQGISDVTVALTNGTWSSGDFLTFSFVNGANALCQTSSNLNASATLAGTPTSSASDSGGATVGGGTITLKSSGNCSGNDEVQLALPASPSDTGTTTFTVTGLSLSLGTAVATGAFDVVATASNGTPFAGSDSDSEQEGTIGTASISSPSVGVSGTTTVETTVGPIKVTDVVGKQLTTGTTPTGNITFTLGGTDTWGSVGTLTVPSGVTITSTPTSGGAALTFGLSGASPAGGVYTLTGAQANIAAGTAGAHGVTVTTTATGSTLGTLTAQIAYAGTTTRQGGADRYATAALLFNSQFGASVGTPATTAVVASGANYPDALSAAYLAGSFTPKTGVLLTDPNTLSQATKQVLTNGKINTVYIVGGTAAVSQNVQNQIQALNIGNNAANGTLSVIRLQGADRYATNFQVVLNGGVSGATSGGTAIIASGANYPDALAVGPAAAAAGIPIILTTPGALSSTASSAISALGISHAIIVGGTSAVSAAVETALTNAGVTVDLRLGGADRTETAALVGEWEVSTGTFTTGSYSGHSGLSFGTTTVNLARGDNYPDALAAGPVLGSLQQVVLLSASPTSLGTGVGSFFGSGTMNTTTINGIGLASALSGSTLGAALGAAS